MALEEVGGILQSLPLVGGLAGALFGGGGASSAEKKWREYLQRYVEGMPMPSTEELLGAYQAQGPSAFEGMTEDPYYQQVRREAMQEMMSDANQYGLGPAERARFQEGLDTLGQANRGAQEAIGQSFASRGQYGGGAELMNRLLGQQGAYSSAANLGRGAISDAASRALTERTGAAGIAQGASELDINRKSAIANARDIMNRFNATARRGAYGDETANWATRAGMASPAYGGEAYYRNLRRKQDIETGGGLGDLAAGVGNFLGRQFA